MYECLKELHVVTIVCEQAHKAEHKRNLISEQSALWGVKEKEGACGHSLMLPGFIKRMSTCPLPSFPFVLLDKALFCFSPLKQLGSLMTG